MKRTWLILIVFIGIAGGCQTQTAVPTIAPVAEMALQPQTAVPTSLLPPHTSTPDIPTPDTLTPNTPSQTPIPPTATGTPTATPLGPCDQRVPSDDTLLTIVTLTYAISRNYQPADLVPLADYLPVGVTLGYPTEIRRVVIEPLVEMIDDMRTAGLQPQILSAYRSYATQAIAWDKWNREEPERAAILSAPPGHSEHQLGTTVDFGSPELPAITGIEDIQFHTYFYQTSEGLWLLENAHRYGFTLSYPREAFEITGFYYEPWHYRYVGVDMATQLKELGISLTEHLLITQPAPCIPPS